MPLTARGDRSGINERINPKQLVSLARTARPDITPAGVMLLAEKGLNNTEKYEFVLARSTRPGGGARAEAGLSHLRCGSAAVTRFIPDTGASAAAHERSEARRVCARGPAQTRGGLPRD